MQSQYTYKVASEEELNVLLKGHPSGFSTHWPRENQFLNLDAGETGIISKVSKNHGDISQPVVLIVRDDDFRRLCGRFAQLRSDFSPLSSWCHLVTPNLFRSVETPLLEPNYGGMEAAWTGLIVAEAQLLAERPISKVKISTCLATQSFAVARAQALWPQISFNDVLERFDGANRLFNSKLANHRFEIRSKKIRNALVPIWNTLQGITQKTNFVTNELRQVVASLNNLQYARSVNAPDEHRRFAMPLVELAPEAFEFLNLESLSPELRLHLFDKIITKLSSTTAEKDSHWRVILGLLAGYLATVAAAGSPSISLAENVATQWPEIIAWAYVIGGIGENVLWTSSFDGLGRLVARELMRPVRFDESPTCDFGYEEGIVLADSKLKDPLVHLRIKQARIANVALFPGVNAYVSINESVPVENMKSVTNRFGRKPLNLNANRIGSDNDTISILADAIWPFIREHIENNKDIEYTDKTSRSQESPQRNKRSNFQTDLPLKSHKK